MNPDLYERACELFGQWVQLPEDEQQRRLSELRQENLGLAVEVERLLQGDQRANSVAFLSPDASIANRFADHESSETIVEVDRIGTRVGQYELRAILGEGGMGTVYRAWDLEAEREVALKLIAQRQQISNEALQRFRVEQRSAAAMSHPNIVTVYSVGSDDGFEYYTMELVQGGRLHDSLHAAVSTPRKIAWQFMKIAKALGYAHERGVIHRDIKPANILLSDEQEPMLTDFGIAKRFGHRDEQTQTGQLIGTLNYMAPEQLADSKNVGPASDIYGLGATLYECLTGKKPFEADSFVELYDEVRHRMPKAPRAVRPGVDPALDAICMRCLQKNPKDRYVSAREVAEDFAHFLKGEPLAVSEHSWNHSIRQFLGFRENHGALESSNAALANMLIAAIVHPLVFLIAVTEQKVVWLWILWGVWALLACLSSYYFHFRQYWQLTVIERQSGLIAMLVNLSLPFLIGINGPLSLDGSVRDFLGVYPPFCLLVAVGLCAHAVIHSGKWFLWGALFFPMSLLLAHFPLASPIVFFFAGAGVMGVMYREIKKTPPDQESESR